MEFKFSFNLENYQIPKNSKFWNYSFLWYFVAFAIFPSFILSFDINFIFYCSDSRKFGRSIFSRSLIFKFEISASLKIYCSKFRPSPKFRSSISKLSIFLNNWLKSVFYFMQMFWFVKRIWLTLARLRWFGIRPSCLHFRKNFCCCIECRLDSLILFHCLKAQWIWYPSWLSMWLKKLIFASFLPGEK